MLVWDSDWERELKNELRNGIAGADLRTTLVAGVG